MTTSSPSRFASRKRALSGQGPFALLSSLGRGWSCGGARLLVPENGGGRGGMPDYKNLRPLATQGATESPSAKHVLQSFPRQATPRAVPEIARWSGTGEEIGR